MGSLRQCRLVCGHYQRLNDQRLNGQPINGRPSHWLTFTWAWPHSLKWKFGFGSGVCVGDIREMSDDRWCVPSLVSDRGVGRGRDVSSWLVGHIQNQSQAVGDSTQGSKSTQDLRLKSTQEVTVNAKINLCIQIKSTQGLRWSQDKWHNHPVVRTCRC